MSQPYEHEPRDLEFHFYDYRHNDAIQKGREEDWLAYQTDLATAKKFAP